MKKKKNKLFMGVSVLIIGFLLCASSFNTLNMEALLEEEYTQYDANLFVLSNWNWTATEVVSTESTGFSYNPSLAVDSFGNVHVVWYDATDYAGSGTDTDIFYKRWEVATSSWTTTEVVSTEVETAGGSRDPSLAVDSVGNVHVAWKSVDLGGTIADYQISYKRWNASSQTWTTTELVSTESSDESGAPSLAVDSVGNVHIAWQDWSDYAGSGWMLDILYKLWNSTSFSWTTTEVVSTESTGLCYNPSLAVDSVGDVHIAWEDRTDYAGSGPGADIFYKLWDTSTSSWTITEVVSTESITDSRYPYLAIDSDGNIHVAWIDWSFYAGSGLDSDIYYKRWELSTSSWTITEVVSTESTEDSFYPALGINSAGDIHIAWRDLSDYANAGTDLDIFYKCWDSSISSWTSTEVVSTESTEASSWTSLVVDYVGNVHIVWHDGTDYNGAGTDYDIFYKLLTGLPSAPELAFIVPNPTESTTIDLDWNNILGSNVYYVYRSTSYIWSVEGLIPIATVSSSDYMDTLSSEGFYYYVVVAANFALNSSHSNCQYVEVKFPDLDAPELSPLLPNPTDLSSISLVWDNIDGATEYYVYRSNSYIWSVEGLIPIATVGSNSYVDSLPSEDYYFYVIVASDGLRNSIHSNCEYVEYKLPTLHEFFIISSLIIGIPVFLFIVTRTRKKKSNQN